MKIQKRTTVLNRTRNSWSSIYDDCSSLIEELEMKELDAFDDDNYYEAFIIQFSYLEWHMDAAIRHYAKTLGVHTTTRKKLSLEKSVSNKITNFDIIMRPFISKESIHNFHVLIENLRDYNAFRNDFLHDSMNSKTFKSAIHIEQSVVEAYHDGLRIIKQLLNIKLLANSLQ